MFTVSQLLRVRIKRGWEDDDGDGKSGDEERREG